MRCICHHHLTDTAWFSLNGPLPLWAAPYVHDSEGIDPHDHDFLEIALVLTGTTTHKWANGQEEIGPGSLVTIQPGVWHAYGPCPSMAVFNCCLAKNLLQGDLAWLLNDPVLKYVLQDGLLAKGHGGVLTISLAPAGKTRYEQSLRELHQILKMRHQATWLEKIAALAATMAGLSAAIRQADPHAASLALVPGRHEAVRRTLAILEADLTREWTVPQLAERAYLERSYFIRLFHAQVGIPPLAYQTRLRAERAAELLLKSDQPVQRIGTMVGWAEPGYFARRFRDFFGVSPKQYRAALKSHAPEDAGLSISASFQAALPASSRS